MEQFLEESDVDSDLTRVKLEIKAARTSNSEGKAECV